MYNNDTKKIYWSHLENFREPTKYLKVVKGKN